MDGRKSRRQALFVSGAVLAFGVRFAGATPLGVVAEGVLGIPLEPSGEFWDCRAPTSLLEKKHFVVAVSGQASEVLNRRYRTGSADEGYAVGVSGGAVVRWDYGVTGIWALGSGQAQTWRDPAGLYTLTPSPKMGVMAVSHAWTKGRWALGATVYRTSFSLTDTFVFDRYPTSTNPLVNRYLWDLLPRAIGKDIAYDALGNRLELVLEAKRQTRLGAFGVVFSGWTASADWITQYTNTIADETFDRAYLAGVKTGDGRGGWHGSAVEGRWSDRFFDEVDLGLHLARGSSSGDASMWLVDPAGVPTPDGTSTRQIEPSDLADNTVRSDSWRAGLSVGCALSENSALRFVLEREDEHLSTAGTVRTPVLTIDGSGGRTWPVQHSAVVGLTGTVKVTQAELGASHRPAGGRWNWGLGVGLLRFDGWANTNMRPTTVGFASRPSAHAWNWSAARLGYAEVSATRQMTQQISLTYSLRQYVPISARLKRDGAPSAMPGDISGLKFGSMHQLSVAMRL